MEYRKLYAYEMWDMDVGYVGAVLGRCARGTNFFIRIMYSRCGQSWSTTDSGVLSTLAILCYVAVASFAYNLAYTRIVYYSCAPNQMVLEKIHATTRPPRLSFSHFFSNRALARSAFLFFFFFS